MTNFINKAADNLWNQFEECYCPTGLSELEKCFYFCDYVDRLSEDEESFLVSSGIKKYTCNGVFVKFLKSIIHRGINRMIEEYSII